MKREKDPSAVAKGRLGGLTTARKHGRDHFVSIGRLGGAVIRSRAGDQVKAAFAALELVEELRSLGLMPSDETIAAARERK